MEPHAGTPRTHLRAAGALAGVAALAVPLAGCAKPPAATPTTADWCWNHYRSAPTGALVADDGPGVARDAAAWDTWLGRTDDAPPERRAAHRVQRELIDRLIETGTWDASERARYAIAASTDPTPSTVCETVGARIHVDADGGLPSGWQERFLDPDDIAHSVTATTHARLGVTPVDDDVEDAR